MNSVYKMHKKLTLEVRLINLVNVSCRCTTFTFKKKMEYVWKNVGKLMR